MRAVPNVVLGEFAPSRLLDDFGTRWIFLNVISASPVPLVSVVVPNYNHRRFLSQRFASIHAQTLRQMEIIVLDDASRDGSAKFLRAMVSPLPFTLEINERNSGNVFAQWAKGIAVARGEFVWIAEADDSCEPDFLETLVALARRHPSVGFIYAQSRIIDERGQTLEETPHYLREIDSSRWQHDYFAKGTEEVANYLILRNTVPNASACLFRRDVLLSLDLAQMPLKLNGDWLAYAQILRRHDVAFLAAPLNHYRRHANTVRVSSDRSELRIRESYVVQKFIADQFEIAPEIRELACRFSFREWRHLQQTAGLPVDIRLNSAELLTAAKSFDPAIAQRFASPSEQALPCARVQQRSWRTAWRWRTQWRSYRDDQSVVLRVHPCEGEVLIDPLSKFGSATVERLSFIDLKSGSVIMVFRGIELKRCLSVDRGALDWRLSENGLHVRCGKKPACVRVRPPVAVNGAPYGLEIMLRAEPPMSWFRPTKAIG